MIYSGRVMKPQFVKEKDKDLTWRMKNIYSDEYAVMDYVLSLENKYKNSHVSYYVATSNVYTVYVPYIKFKDDADEAEFIIKEINA